jgi:hypothetical protein
VEIWIPRQDNAIHNRLILRNRLLSHAFPCGFVMMPTPVGPISQRVEFMLNRHRAMICGYGVFWIVV